MMHTRDQEYAARIFDQITGEIGNRPAAERKKYGGMAHKLPILIRTSGLCQALAFVKARGDDPQGRLLDHLAIVVGVETRDNLLRESRTQDLGDYMYLTRRVLDALLWYKRFAQSVLGIEAGDDSDQPEEGTRQ